MVVSWVMEYDRYTFYRDGHCGRKIETIMKPGDKDLEAEHFGYIGMSCVDFSKKPKVLSFKGYYSKKKSDRSLPGTPELDIHTNGKKFSRDLAPPEKAELATRGESSLATRQHTRQPQVTLSFYEICPLSSTKAVKKGDGAKDYVVGGCWPLQPTADWLYINWAAGFDHLHLYTDGHCEEQTVVVVPGNHLGVSASDCFRIGKEPKILSLKGVKSKKRGVRTTPELSVDKHGISPHNAPRHDDHHKSYLDFYARPDASSNSKHTQTVELPDQECHQVPYSAEDFSVAVQFSNASCAVTVYEDDECRDVIKELLKHEGDGGGIGPRESRKRIKSARETW